MCDEDERREFYINKNLQILRDRNPKVASMTPEEIIHYKQIFNVFDRNKTGIVPVTQVNEIMKILGKYPIYSNVKIMVEEIAPSTIEVDFESFLELVADSNQDAEIEKSIKESFQVLDVERVGYIFKEELSELLMGMAEMYSEEEMVEMIEETDFNQDGKIRYKLLSVMWSVLK